MDKDDGLCSRLGLVRTLVPWGRSMRNVPLAYAFVLGIASVAAQWAFPSPVAACTPASPGPIGVFPLDGTEGLPVNVELRLYYVACTSDWCPNDPVLRVQGGDDVEVSIVVDRTQAAEPPDRTTTVLLIRPTEDLEPGVTYELLDRKVECDGWDCVPCEGADCHEVVSTFATGAEADLEAPTFDATPTGEIRCASCYHDGCCGPYEYTLADIRWDAASDDGSCCVTYDVYRDGTRVATRLGGRYFKGGLGTYRVQAVDVAGNLSALSDPVEVAGTCDFPGPDGGVDAEPDAGEASTSDAGMEDDPPASSKGCATVGGPVTGTGGWIFVLFLLGAWALRWTRRGHRRRSSPLAAD
jgi:hypothetical protein